MMCFISIYIFIKESKKVLDNFIKKKEKKKIHNLFNFYKYPFKVIGIHKENIMTVTISPEGYNVTQYIQFNSNTHKGIHRPIL